MGGGGGARSGRWLGGDGGVVGARSGLEAHSKKIRRINKDCIRERSLHRDFFAICNVDGKESCGGKNRMEII